ncbi:MAG: putative rane family [Actinomycetota bacterium]
MGAGRRASTAHLDHDQRRLLIGTAVVQVALLSLPAGFNYMLPDMLASFDATDGESSALRQVSSLAALLVVFVAGVLGERMGGRKVMLGAALLFTVGSAIVTVAPVVGVATLGLLLANVGKATVTVVALAFVASRIRDADGRASAFATLASVVPITYLVIPVVAGAMTSAWGWRWVALMWTVLGVLAVFTVARRIPAGGTSLVSGEMWTPAIAGLLLAATVQALTSLADEGLSSRTIGYAIVVGIALIVLIIAYRRIPEPSLSLAPLRQGGVLVLLVVLVLFSFANLYYYNTLLYQVVYGYSALGAAVVMIPAQLGSIAGAVVGRKLLQRLGIAVSGSTMILILGATMLIAAAAVRESSPIIVPVLIVSCYAVASVAAFVALTTAIMAMAESGEEGVTSSYKTASSNIGAALGVCVLTAVVTTVGVGSMQAQMESSGTSSSTSAEAAWALLYGDSPQDVSDQYGISVTEADQLQEMERVAFVDAYRAQALVGGLMAILCGAIFLAARRRYQPHRT